MSKEFFENNAKLNIENWPNLLYSESMATVILTLSPEEQDALIKYHPFKAEEETPSEEVEKLIKAIIQKITQVTNNFPNGAFVKLGSRSPKDSYIGYKEGFRCVDGDKAIQLFNDSERVIDDLFKDQYHNYPTRIIVREWIEMPKWAEFRGFIKNRKLVGLSQYNYLNRKAFPEIVKHADSIRWAIEKKVERIADLLPLPDVVADFLYKVKTYGNERVSEVKLIELNPFSYWTDPCLFHWNKDKFETFQFRYFTE